MKKYILFLFIALSECVTTPKIDNMIQSVPGFEFEEFRYSSGTIGNTYNTEILATNAKIEDGVLQVESFQAGNKNTFFNVGISLKGLKRPITTGAASATGN